MLSLLFTAVQSTVLRMFHKDNKTERFTPGFICVLHTFGRDLKWNPHIHCLISEGGAGNSGLWKPKKHFSYTFLRNAFRTVLLNLMEAKLGSSFKKVKAMCYRDHKDGFYVYAKPNKCKPRDVLKYIGRYLGRPVIATSRIDSYDGEFVTFHYNRHEDDKLVYETIPAMHFIKRLIRHIPEKHFKMVRYYGIYARHRKSDNSLIRAIHPSKHSFFLSLNRWRDSIAFSFGYDPLRCPCCNNHLSLLDLYIDNKRVPIEDLFRKAVQKYKSVFPS